MITFYTVFFIKVKLISLFQLKKLRSLSVYCWFRIWPLLLVILVDVSTSPQVIFRCISIYICVHTRSLMLQCPHFLAHWNIWDKQQQIIIRASFAAKNPEIIFPTSDKQSLNRVHGYTCYAMHLMMSRPQVETSFNKMASNIGQLINQILN